MKSLIATTLLVILAVSAQAQVQAYHATNARLHDVVDKARETLVTDLKQSEENADSDDSLFNKILLDEQKFNTAIQHLHNFQEGIGPEWNK
jgi:hypothetical protein